MIQFIQELKGVNMQINYSDEDVKKGIKSIFLAGPRPRDANVIS